MLINMKSPKLSIIIPVYNVEEYIGRCLDSIYNQGIDESFYETIIVNDGTLDNSVSVIEPYVDKYINCRLVNQMNQGLSMARNNGFEHANGDYVWFVDSDDWLAERSINIVLEYISEGRYNLIASNLIYSYDDESNNYIERKTDNDVIITAADYMLNYCIGASQRYIINRDLMIKNNLRFYPGILHEDGEFGPRLLCAAGRVLLTHHILYKYYQRGEGSIMGSWKLRNTQNSLIVYQRDIELLQNIEDKQLKDSVEYGALAVLLFAFPRCHVKNIAEIEELYQHYKCKIRKISWRLIFSTIPFKKKMRVAISFVNPMLWLCINDWLNRKNMINNRILK